MENNTIKCPFCFKESQRGVHVCTGCLATVLYGTYPGWYAAVVLLLTFGLSVCQQVWQELLSVYQ